MPKTYSNAELKQLAAIGDADIAGLRTRIEILKGVVKYLDKDVVKRTRAESLRGLWFAKKEA